MEPAMSGHRHALTSRGPMLGALAAGILLAYWSTLGRGGSLLFTPFLLIVAALASATLNSLRLRRPRSLNWWLWLVLPGAAALPLLRHLIRVAGALQQNAPGDAARDYTATCVFLLALYLAWIVGFPFEESFGTDRRRHVPGMKAALAGGALTLLFAVSARGIELARSNGPTAPAQALQHWSTTASFLVSAFLFARVFGPAVIAGNKKGWATSQGGWRRLRL
jgi:hypothetical protein